MATKAGLKEFKLAYSDRNGVEELTGPLADARRIQNVIFGHGRAGDYGLGVDLQSYLHEISDQQTLDEIRNKIQSGIKKYCPQVPILELVVETLAAEQEPTGRKNMTLLVGVSIGTDTGKPYDFAVTLRKDAKGNIVSSLVL